RDFHVTGVQTCALPIYRALVAARFGQIAGWHFALRARSQLRAALSGMRERRELAPRGRTGPRASLEAHSVHGNFARSNASDSEPDRSGVSARGAAGTSLQLALQCCDSQCARSFERGVAR